MTISENWLPTAANINSLPEPIRRYIHDIETSCDPTGDMQTIACLRDQVKGLVEKTSKTMKYRIEVSVESYEEANRIERCVNEDWAPKLISREIGHYALVFQTDVAVSVEMFIQAVERNRRP